jgi:hypothetical protein
MYITCDLILSIRKTGKSGSEGTHRQTEGMHHEPGGSRGSNSTSSNNVSPSCPVKLESRVTTRESKGSTGSGVTTHSRGRRGVSGRRKRPGDESGSGGGGEQAHTACVVDGAAIVKSLLDSCRTCGPGQGAVPPGGSCRSSSSCLCCCSCCCVVGSEVSLVDSSR